MGNHIGNFSDGDLMFIGSNLPHVWKNDKDFYCNIKDLFVDVYVIQFREDALGKDFFELPEFSQIKKLFKQGQQGLLLKENGKRVISNLIKSVYHSTGVERISLFLKLLETIASESNYELLSSIGYADSVNTKDTERINKVINFLMENYTHEINLDELATLVNLNKSSFCRYFKNRTHKTLSTFLNEVRIAHACKLLINTNMTVSQICYETGYNNISHFNRQFKQITNSTAKEYAKKYLVSSENSNN
jgi:AraC-like DNA-binding protein